MRKPDAETQAQAALPWATAPSNQGEIDCAWCHRAIHAPALPCSVKAVKGIERIATGPGRGDRCKYEMRTRGLLDESNVPG